MKTPGKGLEDFAAAHDPRYEGQSPVAIFDPLVLAGTTRFIITAAQNATPVHKDWWAVLMQIAAKTKASMLIAPLRYKNPTSTWRMSQENVEHWADEVRPYLCNTRKVLNENLMFLGDIKIQPTASSPLTGADALSHASSGIIGHTKVQLRSIPTPQNRMAKLLTTTGACTVPNYSDTRAGRIGEFHHSLAAVLVETDGKTFFIRHLHYDEATKTCTDLNTRYSAKGAEPAPRALALVMGDTHVDFIDPAVEKATFGRKGIVETLQPEALIFHDLLDAYSCNPHHAGNPFNALAKLRGGLLDVQAEVDRAITFVRLRTPKNARSWVLASNHNDFLARWMVNTDWRREAGNAKFYLETALAMVEGTKLTSKGAEYPHPFNLWFERAKVPRARILERDESLLIAQVELGMHGDAGPNGARGSIKNLRRLGVKSIIGHSHSAGIDEGCYQVGTSTKLRLEYNHGASSWLNAHCVLNADGKRQLLIIVDGRWRA